MEPQRPSKAKTIWIIVLIFIVGLSNTAWGLFYFKQTNDKGQLNSKVTNLSESVNGLNGEIASLKKTSSAVADKNTAQWREIPELGIKYKITSETKDFTYLYTGGPEESGSIATSTKALSSSSYKAKNPSGATVENAYFCGLGGDGALSAGVIGVTKSLGTDQAKLSGIKSKKMSNGVYLTLTGGGVGNGSGTSDANNSLTPTPIDGCDKKLQDSATATATAVFNSIVPN